MSTASAAQSSTSIETFHSWRRHDDADEMWDNNTERQWLIGVTSDERERSSKTAFFINPMRNLSEQQKREGLSVEIWKFIQTFLRLI